MPLDRLPAEKKILLANILFVLAIKPKNKTLLIIKIINIMKTNKTFIIGSNKINN